jgi:hypothetical protein
MKTQTQVLEDGSTKYYTHGEQPGRFTGSDITLHAMFLKQTSANIVVQKSLTITERLELRGESSLAIIDSVTNLIWEPEAEIRLIESDQKLPRIQIPTNAASTHPKSISINISADDLPPMKYLLLHGGSDFTDEACRKWISITRFTNRIIGSLQCTTDLPDLPDSTSKLVLDVPQETQTTQKDDKEEEKYWTDGRIIGLSVGLGVLVIGIVAAILIYDYVTSSKKRPPKVHPKDEDSQQDEEDASEPNPGSQGSPRQDLLDEMPIENDAPGAETEP